MNPDQTLNTFKALQHIFRERTRQDAKWGEQNHRDGTGNPMQQLDAEEARAICDRVFEEDNGSWMHILQEEVSEAFAESDPMKLRKELVQVAAVAAAWIEAIDRRGDGL